MYYFEGKEYDGNQLFDYLRGRCLRRKHRLNKRFASDSFDVLDALGKWFKATFQFNEVDEIKSYFLKEGMMVQTNAKEDFPYFIEGQLNGIIERKGFVKNTEVLEYLKQHPNLTFRLEKLMPNKEWKVSAISYDSQSNWLIINRKIYKLNKTTKNTK